MTVDAPFYRVYRTARAGEGFPLWGPYHLSWLAGSALFLVLLLIVCRRSGTRARRGILLTLTGLLTADELFKHAMLLLLGEEGADYLPLHLCSVGLFVCLWYAVKPGVLPGELLYAVSLPGAAVALLFPGWSDLPPESFLTVHSFTFHLLLAAIPLCLLVSGEIRPRAKRLWFCAAFLLVTAVPVWLVDRKYGTNFYFLTYPGRGNPLELFALVFGDPGYQIGLPVCTALLWLGMYGIPALIRRIFRNTNLKLKG